MSKRPRFLAAVIAAACAGPAAVAEAGPPGTWTRVTPAGSEVLNFMQVSLVRTADGVLHVGWAREDAGSAGSALHSAIAANAKSVSGPSTIFSNPDGVNQSVVLVRAPGGGLRAFFAATNAFDSVLATAVSADGASWTVQGAASRSGPAGKPVYAASGIGAAVGTDGTFFTSWGDSSPNGGGFHAGLDPSAPDGSIPGGLMRDPNVGVDAGTGRVVAAWNSLAGEGVVTMGLAPGGAHASIPTSAPQLQHRVGITGRIGAAGVFVAFTQGSNPFLAKPAVFRVDTGKAKRLSRRDAEDISIAAGPGGRLWVMWRDGSTLLATRSNPAATTWGRIVKLLPPKGTSAVYDVAGEGSRGPLDLVALAQGAEIASWHQRVLPGLTLTKHKGKHGATVLKVTDAGAAVKSAKVTVKGEGTKKTGAKGTVSFDLADGRYRAKARKKGYTEASLRFRVT